MMIPTTNAIHAICVAVPAIPLNPKTAAIIAIIKNVRAQLNIIYLYGRLPVWQAIFRVLVKIKSAAVLYPALLQIGFLSAGPDGIRQERSHLLIVLEALEKIQVYVLAVRPVSPSHGFIYLRNLSAFHSF